MNHNNYNTKNTTKLKRLTGELISSNFIIPHNIINSTSILLHPVHYILSRLYLGKYSFI